MTHALPDSALLERTGASEAALPQREPERDSVDETSIESFPASDPPAWIWMRVGPPAVGIGRPKEAE